MFTKESLEKLRDKIDLTEVISGYVELKRAGAAHKALCPFHQEKTPSFMIQKGDSCYHCFGCGAHGDAIQFLMNYLNISFVEAVESLAERFNVSLEKQDYPHEKGSDKLSLKETCRIASAFFHACLLHTEEGKHALTYLYKRSITIDFIRRFEVGFAPNDSKLLQKVLKQEKVEERLLIEAGLLTAERKAFFRDRITFPIQIATGGIVGFSARKYKEDTFGGKYINSPETMIFKKSRILFGLNFSRRRIIKERRVVIVEGQIDCLKMIESGLNLTVAALGTSFGESHVEELEKLHVREAYLIFDSDEAGSSAASKVGNLLQKKGIDVFIVTLPKGNDPDSYLTQFGMHKLLEEIEKATPYLIFQISFIKEQLNLDSPAGKAELINTLKKQIEQWEEPVMVHETLRKLASLLQVPEEFIATHQNRFNQFLVKNQGTLVHNVVDTQRVLELDLLRWLILMGDQFFPTARAYLSEKHFYTDSCRRIFQLLLQEGKSDLLTLASTIEDSSVIDEILQKKINRERAESLFLETVQKLLDREWMQKRESIRVQILNEQHLEERVFQLAKEFEQLKNARPIALLIK